MIKISDISVRSINRALYKLWYKICCLVKRVEVLEEGGGGGEMQNIQYVQELTDIITIDGTNIDSIIVGNENTGGDFLKYSGAYGDDGGVVLTDANGQKWKRIVDDYIDIRWFGATPVTIQQFDSAPAVIAAITASYSTEIISSPIVFIPKSPATNQHYFLNQTINLSSKIRIFGQDYRYSHLRFKDGLNGITTTYPTAAYTELENFKISSFVPSEAVMDYTKAGLTPNATIYVNNLTVNGFPDGVNLKAAAPTGNTNNSIFHNLSLVQNRRHGVYIDGPDANNITFYNLDCNGNGGCGVVDSSFLGNHYYTPHFATNCAPTISWQKGLVKHGGIVYQSLQDENIGVEPGVTVGWANYWETNSVIQAWLAFGPVGSWIISGRYHRGAAYFFDGANQWGSMNNSYTEEDQPLSTMSSRSTIIGGNAVTRNASALLKANTGQFYTKSLKIGNAQDNTTDVVVKLGSSADGTSVRGIGVTTINPNGIWLDYFPGTTALGQSMGAFKNQAGGSHTRFLTSGTNTTTTGRTATAQSQANLALFGPMYFSFNTTRNTLRELDFSGGANSQYVFSLANKQEGDMVLATRTNMFEKPEYVGFKVIAPVTAGTLKWVGVKAFEEQLVTQAAAGTYVIGRDVGFASGRGILYDITFVGTSGSDTAILHHEILVTHNGTTVAVTNNTAIRADLVPGVFATTAININIVTTNSVEVQLINLPASTNGKINIKRIDY